MRSKSPKQLSEVGSCVVTHAYASNRKSRQGELRPIGGAYFEPACANWLGGLSKNCPSPKIALRWLHHEGIRDYMRRVFDMMRRLPVFNYRWPDWSHSVQVVRGSDRQPVIGVFAWAGAVLVLASIAMFLPGDPASSNQGDAESQSKAELAPAASEPKPTVAQESPPRLEVIDELPVLLAPPALELIADADADVARAGAESAPVDVHRIELTVRNRPTLDVDVRTPPAVLAVPPAPTLDEAETVPQVHIQNVGEPVSVVARLTGSDSEPVGAAAVEWRLVAGGVGRIIGVDPQASENGFDRPMPSFARTWTAKAPEVLPLTNEEAELPALEPGTSLCTLSSHVAGYMVLTALSPEIAAPDEREAVLRVYWRQAAAEFPESGQALAGSEAALTTRVYSASSGRPLAGYRVVYRLDEAGGARWSSDAASVEAVSDASGIARVVLTRDDLISATTKIHVELLSRPSALAQAPVNLESRSVAIEWVKPEFDIVTSAPEVAGVGDTVQVLAQAAGPNVEALKHLRLRAVVPRSVAVLGHEIDPDSPQTIDLGPYDPADKNPRELVLRSDEPGARTVRFELRSDRHVYHRAALDLQFALAELAIEKELPENWTVGQPAQWTLRIKNNGPIAAGDVRVIDEIPAGLRIDETLALRGAHELIWPVGILQPGEERSLVVHATPTRSFARRALTARGTGRKAKPTEVTTALSVRGTAALTLSLKDIADPIKVDGVAEYVAVVRNIGTEAARDIELSASLSGVLKPMEMTGTLPGEIVGGAIRLEPIRRLEPGAKLSCRIRARAAEVGEGRLSMRIIHQAVGAEGLESQESTIIYRDK